MFPMSRESYQFRIAKTRLAIPGPGLPSTTRVSRATRPARRLTSRQLQPRLQLALAFRINIEQPLFSRIDLMGQKTRIVDARWSQVTDKRRPVAWAAPSIPCALVFDEI